MNFSCVLRNTVVTCKSIDFMGICIRHTAQQVVKNLGGWKYGTSLQGSVNFSNVQCLRTAQLNTFSPVVEFLLGKITRKLLKGYCETIEMLFQKTFGILKIFV